MKNKLVITGMGLITPIGNTVDEYWKNLTESVSGVAAIESIDTEGLPVRFAGEVGFRSEGLHAQKAERRNGPVHADGVCCRGSGD